MSKRSILLQGVLLGVAANLIGDALSFRLRSVDDPDSNVYVFLLAVSLIGLFLILWSVNE